MGKAWRRDWRSERDLILRLGGKFQGYGKGMLKPEVLIRPREKSVPQIYESGAHDSQPISKASCLLLSWQNGTGCFKEQRRLLPPVAGERGWASASDRPGHKCLFHHHWASCSLSHSFSRNAACRWSEMLLIKLQEWHLTGELPNIWVALSTLSRPVLSPSV